MSECYATNFSSTLGSIRRCFGVRDTLAVDVLAYSVLANDLARGLLHTGDLDYDPVIFPFRVGVYAPTALLIKIFGLSEATIAAFPFLISIGNCLLAYVLARQLFGSTAGLISIAILAILPIDISMASTLYADAIAAFWATLGVAIAFPFKP